MLFPFTDLPPNARLDDLASLLQLDTKNVDPEKLGVDLIKQQQAINLKFSSNQSAVIPDDQAQVMLAGVSVLNVQYSPSNAHTFSSSIISLLNALNSYRYSICRLCSYSNIPVCLR